MFYNFRKLSIHIFNKKERNKFKSKSISNYYSHLFHI